MILGIDDRRIKNAWDGFPEKQLWSAVLYRAIQDIFNGPKFVRKPTENDGRRATWARLISAIEFLFSESNTVNGVRTSEIVSSVVNLNNIRGHVLDRTRALDDQADRELILSLIKIVRDRTYQQLPAVYRGYVSALGEREKE